MATTTSYIFRADVMLTLPLTVCGTTPADAESAARAALVARGVNPRDISSVQIRALDTDEQLHAENIRLWQESEVLRARGSAQDRHAWSLGVLGSEHIATLAREALFAPFDGQLARRRKLGVAAIPHPRTSPGGAWVCAQAGAPIPVHWRTTPDPSLTELQWQSVSHLLKLVEQVATHPWLAPTTDAVTFALVMHSGSCERCQRSVLEHAARVNIVWGGRTLSREYLL